MGTKVLDLSTDPSLAKALWPDAEITCWDFSSPLPDEMMGQFDEVFASNVLQRVSYRVSLSMITVWGAALKVGGRLHIIVPSLEWCAREVLSENPNPVTLILLWGGQGGDGSIHMSGYTMRLLRADFEKVGLSVINAKTQQYTLKVNDVEYPTEQHYICGSKGRAELQKE